MNIYFPLYFDAGNRGCEAIAKGTAKVLGMPKSQLIAYSRDTKLDHRLELDKLYTLLPTTKETFFQKIIRKIKFFTKIHSSEQRRDYVFAQSYNNFLDLMSSKDIMFSTGGDMLCYSDNQVNYTNNYISQKNIKTVLWGCSIGAKNLTTAKIETLKKFSAITVRESLTKNMLEELGIKNVYLFPDPAFALDSEKCQLPKIFTKGKIVGINLSNFVGHDVSKESIIGKNLYNMIQHILETTNYNILFIPHVLWKGQDDRIICNEINDIFKISGRTEVLDSNNFGYCQIRYIISKCDLFIGARTHSVISAYSTCIPTLALGYSVKSIGIAKDLCLPNETVVDCLHMDYENVLNIAFDYLYKNKDKIRTILNNNIPKYKNKSLDAKMILQNL